MKDSGGTEKQRLFFALWPDDRLRGEIARAVHAVEAGREAIAGNRVAPERYHLTLLFLGDLHAQYAPLALEAAAGVSAASFELVLDRLGYFPGAQALWIGPEKAPPEITGLRRNLHEAMRSRRVPHERKILTPHITCLRKVPREPPLGRIEPLRWQVRDFVLLHSVLTGRPEYRVLARWPLSGAGGAVKTGQQRQLWE